MKLSGKCKREATSKQAGRHLLLLALACLLCDAELHAQNWHWGVHSVSSVSNNGLQCHGVGHTPDVIPGAGMYNTGEYWSQVQTSFGGGVIMPASVGLNDAYVCKFDGSGNFLWANAMQGSKREVGMKVVADRYDNCYVVGNFSSDQLTLYSSNGATMTINNASNGGTTSDVFVAKYDPNGFLLWAISCGGTEDERGIDIAMGHQTQSTVLITGGFFSPQAAFGSTILNNVNPSGNKEDAYVAVLDVTNGLVLNAWSYGGTGHDVGMSLISDGTTHIHVTGSFSSSLMPMGMTNLSTNGADDMFLTDIDFNSGVPNWAVSAGSVSNDAGLSLAAAGPYLYVAGIYRNAINFGGPSLAPAGGADAFLAQYDLSGAAQWARPIAGSDTEQALCVTAWCDNIYVGGRVASQSINLGNTTLSNPTNGIAAFLIKYNDAGVDLWSVVPAIHTDQSVLEDLVVFAGPGGTLNDFNVGLCGNFIDMVDFGPYWFAGGGGIEGFVCEFDDNFSFNLTAGGTFCATDPAVNFSAVPSGGTWSGPGITDPVLGTFDPNAAGTGTHTITYSLALGTSCVLSKTAQVTVYAVNWPKHPLPTLAASAYATEVIGSHLAGDGQYFITGQHLGVGSIDFGGNTTPLATNDADIFVAMYDDCGAQWSFSEGSPGWKDEGVALKYSAFDGKLYLAGNLGGGISLFNGTGLGVTNSTDPPLALSIIAAGKSTGFLAQLNLDGSVNWVSVIDPTSAHSNYVSDISIDQGTGMIYVVGDYDNTIDFSPGGGIHTAPGNAGIYLAKYNNSGFVQWSAAYGIGNVSRGKGVDVYNNNGDVLITGFVGKLPGFGGSTDYFVRRYTAAGGVVMTIHTPTDYNSYGSDIVADQINSNQYFVTGAFTDIFDLSTSFSPLAPFTSNGNYDVFSVAYDFSNQLQWANSAGGAEHDEGRAIALVNDDVWYCGTLKDLVVLPVWPFTHSTLNATPDIFVARHKILNGASGTFTISNGSGAGDLAADIAVNQDGFAYVTGQFDGSLSLNTTLNANSTMDPYLARLEPNGWFQNYFRNGADDEARTSDDPQPLRIELSPNPAQEVLRVQIDVAVDDFDTEIVIMDLRGALVHRSVLNGAGPHSLRVNLRELSAGSYYVRVRNGLYQASQSFVRY